MNNSFKDLIGEDLLVALNAQGITTPTDIQQNTIRAIMEGNDLVGTSQTGSGKTLAYLLPAFQKINLAIKQPQVIVLTPTHELAKQVFKQAELLVKNGNLPFKATLLIGGVSIKKQLESLKEKPRIVIGSAGRILEIIKMKKMTGHYLNMIVLDEADRMVDSYNIGAVRDIIKTTLKDRQIVMFSASIDENTKQVAKEIMKEPQTVQVNHALPTTVEHMYFIAEKRDKIEILRKIVHGANIKKAIVFLNQPSEIENTTKRLNYHSVKAAALHGEAMKAERRKALLDFKTGAVTLLVASDIAARGLDIKDLTHVINLDVPEDPTFYLHRAGRVGRMGEKGTCITIAEKHSCQWIQKYEKAFGIVIPKKQMSYGEIKDDKK